MSLDQQLRNAGLSPEAAAAVAPLARRVTAPAGAVLFRPGDACQAFLTPLSGRLDVVLVAAGGREIGLYTVGPSDLCLQTLQCLATGAAYAAEGRVTEDLEAAALTPAQFDALLAGNAAFRAFVLDRVAARFAMLSDLVEALATVPVPVRLAATLLRRAQGGTVAATHAGLATDVGTAREVISRRLEQWSQAGIVRQTRGRIEILDAARLSQIAAAGE
jgi:CRP/FNR family transcriptional regulator